jgi:hypothetical protein
VPQEVPLEASDVLVFTPDCLKALDDPPRFTLRAGTWREKERRLDLHAMVGAINHSKEAIRAEIRAGLQAGWTAAQCEAFLPLIEQYWTAEDLYETERKDDPDLPWSYDAETERRVQRLFGQLERTWPDLGQIAADLRKYRRLEPVIYFAVIVREFAGLAVTRDTVAGYLSVDCAYAIREALNELDDAAGVPIGTAAMELQIACMKRLFLDEDFAKNSASPSPSAMTPPASTPTPTSEADGKSPAPARSRKTRQSA